MGLFSSLAKAILTGNGVSDSAAMAARDSRHPAARVIDIDGDCQQRPGHRAAPQAPSPNGHSPGAGSISKAS